MRLLVNMDYDSLTVLKLKTICKERGLRVSGTKAEVVIRLMENDEGNAPVPQQISVPQMQQMQPQIIQITNSNNTGVAQTFGIFIILYGIFRIGMAMFFSVIDEQVFILESFLAWMIGISFIFGGAITTMGYRNGPIMTLGVLLVSGTFSIIYHDEWSPLSIGLDGSLPISWSLMCSSMCLMITAIPLFLPSEEMKTGWPGTIQRIVGNGSSNSSSSGSSGSSSGGKVTYSCPHCDADFKVPVGFSGAVRCPSCKERTEI